MRSRRPCPRRPYHVPTQGGTHVFVWSMNVSIAIRRSSRMSSSDTWLDDQPVHFRTYLIVTQSAGARPASGFQPENLLMTSASRDGLAYTVRTLFSTAPTA